MGDERLRALERDAQAGDPSARARLLAERVRVGALRAERLALAALLDDPAARLALAGAAATPPVGVVPLVEALERFGRDALVRGALAAGHAALPRWTALAPNDDRVVEALRAAAAWLDRPEPALARALPGHLEIVQQRAANHAFDQPAGLAAAQAEISTEAHEQAVAAWDAEVNAAVFAARAASGAVRCVTWLAEGASLYSLANYARDALFDAAGAIGEPAVLSAVRADVVAWALR